MPITAQAWMSPPATWRAFVMPTTASALDAQTPLIRVQTTAATETRQRRRDTLGATRQPLPQGRPTTKQATRLAVDGQGTRPGRRFGSRAELWFACTTRTRSSASARSAFDVGFAGKVVRLERDWRIPVWISPTPQMLVGDPRLSAELARY